MDVSGLQNYIYSFRLSCSPSTSGFASVSAPASFPSFLSNIEFHAVLSASVSVALRGLLCRLILRINGWCVRSASDVAADACRSDHFVHWRKSPFTNSIRAFLARPLDGPVPADLFYAMP